MQTFNNWMRAVLVFGGGIVLLLILIIIHIHQGQTDVSYRTIFEAVFFPNDSLAHATVRMLRLPRVVIGILTGGALAVAGVILQTLTRNPLASAGTLGIHAGAYFVVVCGTVFVPGLLSGNSFLFAFFGGALTAFIVYQMSGGSKVTPVKMALAGMVLTLMFSAFTATLQIFYENETAGLFLWGAGTLIQIDWDGVQFALPFIGVALLASLIMAKKLNILLLGDDVAVSLGAKVGAVRFLAFVVAIFLTAVTVSVVGPIGFIGLIAPHLMRFLGYQQHLPLILSSFLWGGIVLVGADVLARVIDTSYAELPVGSITALIGAPWLIWLVFRMDNTRGGFSENASVSTGKLQKPIPFSAIVVILLTFVIATIFIGISIGVDGMNIKDTWNVLIGKNTGFLSNLVLDLRLPRVLVAAIVGASLGVCGLIFQGVLRNPLADPSVIGVTSGAGTGALTILLLFPSLSAAFIPLGAFTGAMIGISLVLLLAWKAKLNPSVLALMGIGISAFFAAIIQIYLVKADLSVAVALTWLSGTTYARGWSTLEDIIWPFIVLVPLIFVLMKELDVLSLGDDTAQGLGLRVTAFRLGLSLLAALLASFSVATVGTISFLGLVAPHLARMVTEQNHYRLMICTALFGAVLFVLADVIGRTVFAPNEIPSGLVTAMIGAPYFLWVMSRAEKKAF